MAFGHEMTSLRGHAPMMLRRNCRSVAVRACSIGVAVDVSTDKAFGRLSGPGRQDRRSLCAGRRHRRGGAHAGAGDGEKSRRQCHDREQAGGGDHHRNPGRRRQRARWLHAADGDVCQCGQSEPERKTALRSAQGFRAGGAGGALVQHRRGQSQIADQVDRGPDRGGQGRARQIVLWDVRHRHLGASGRRIVQEHGQGQSGHDPLQGRGARHHRPDRRPDPGDVHDGRERRRADRERPVARARGDLGGTFAGVSAIADGRRGRRSRLCRGKLVWPVRAGQDAAPR